MDGKGRATDNVFIERLWRTVKYEDARFKNYQNGVDMAYGLGHYFDEYNTGRRHSSLDDLTPKAVYFGQD
jgi:putative transposase